MIDTIINGDCLEVMGDIADGSIDLTVTSPPYDNMRDYSGYTFDFEGIAKQLYRVTKDGGVVVWIVSDQTINGSETGTSFRQALFFMECGFRLHDTMIWSKGGFTSPESNRYPPTFEYMFVFSKGAPKTFNGILDRVNIHNTGTLKKQTKSGKNGDKVVMTGVNNKPRRKIGVRFNVWNIPPEKSNTTRTDHPAQMAEKIARDHILSWSTAGDIVLDPFLGSGTTAKMAIETGRHYIGIEVSEEYIKIAKRRLLSAKTPLLTVY